MPSTDHILEKLAKALAPPANRPAAIGRNDGAGLIRDLRASASEFIAVASAGRPMTGTAVTDFARQMSWLGWIWNQWGRRPTEEEMDAAWRLVEDIWNATGQIRADSIDLRCCLSSMRSELLERRAQPRAAAELLVGWLADMGIQGEPRMKHLRRLEQLWREAGDSTQSSAVSAERVLLSHKIAEGVFAGAFAHPSPVLEVIPVIRDYVDHVSPSSRGGIVWFRDLPWDELDRLGQKLGKDFLDFEWNQAPSPRVLLSVTRPHQGETFFSGLVVLPPRHDARLSIDGVITRPTKAVSKWKETADDFEINAGGNSVWVWWD